MTEVGMTATEFEIKVMSEGKPVLPPHPCRFTDIIWVKRNLGVFLTQIEKSHEVVVDEDRGHLREYLSIWQSHELECVREAVQVSLSALPESP